MGLTRRAAIIQNWDLQLIANFLSELDHIAGCWPMTAVIIEVPSMFQARMNAVVRHRAVRRTSQVQGGQRYSRKMPQAEDMTGRFPDDRTPRLSFACYGS